MTKRDASQVMPVVVAAVLGVAMAFVCVPLLGISSAVAAPPGYFPWAKANGLLEPALFVWETVVVGGIGIGAPALVALVILWVAFPNRRLAVLTAFAVSVLVGLYIVVPASYLEPPALPVGRRWWSFGKELSLALVVALVCVCGWVSRITTRWSGP